MTPADMRPFALALQAVLFALVARRSAIHLAIVPAVAACSALYANAVVSGVHQIGFRFGSSLSVGAFLKGVVWWHRAEVATGPCMPCVQVGAAARCRVARSGCHARACAARREWVVYGPRPNTSGERGSTGSGCASGQEMSENLHFWP